MDGVTVPTPAPPSRLDRWTAVLLCLPPLLLAVVGPTSLIQHDFLPHATGAGVVALASIPFAVLLLLRRGTARSRGMMLFGVLLLAITLRRTVGEISDTFEARRALLAAGTAFVFLLGGASLAGVGARTYARGIVLLSIAYVLGALADRQDGFAGALGNTGSIAMAAVPGAVAGGVFLGTERGPWRVVGGIALGLFLAFVLRVPVIAGGLAAGAALAVLAWRARGRARILPGALAALAVLCALAPIALRRVVSSDANRALSSRDANRALSASGATGAGAETESGADSSSDSGPESGSGSGSESGFESGPGIGSESGGFEVRARVWAASLELLAAHPLLGVGPGQFAARFPPYRDPREIELSTHGRALPVETEVEHPHEDWIAPSLDLGGIAGLVWIVFLLVVAASSLRALRPIAVESDPSRAALGAAATAALAYALVHAPLTYEPAAASIAFVAFGAVLPRGRPFRPWPVLITLVAAPAALGLVTHGRSLALLARPGEQDVVVVAAAIERALNACPDSPLARTLRARLCEERGDDPKLVAEAWTHVLEVRPHRVEAIMQLAFAHLRTGEPERAREEYRRALALDPTHPGIVKNLRLLDLQEGRFESGREWLDEADPSPETCFARAKAERDGGDALLADLLEARAHLYWARQHADAGRFEDAVRSYRQSLRVTRDHVGGGARRVRLEFAAALAESGRESDARTEIADLGTRSGDREALPRWAAERLARLGIAGF